MKILSVSTAILSLMFMAVLAGCVGNEQEITTPDENVHIQGGSGPDWCRAGASITVSDNVGVKGEYVIKGITTYEGKEMCQAVMDSEDVQIIQYFNKDNTEMIMMMKDKKTGETREIRIK